MTCLRKKCPFSRPKFLMTFFVIDHDFRIFPILFKISHIFGPCNAVYGPFFTRKTLFQKIIPLRHHFLLCSFFRNHPTNTTSENIVGTVAWAFPPPQIFGETVPPFPLGLRPYLALGKFIPGRFIVPEWTWPGRGTFCLIPGLSRAIRDTWSP